MRKPLLISSLCFVLGFSLSAQNNHVISFAKDSLKVSRGKSKAIIEIDINVQTIVGLDSSSLNIVQDLANSDFPSSSFTVTPSAFKPVLLSGVFGLFKILAAKKRFFDSIFPSAKSKFVPT